jgi:hypothetical protein
VTMSLRRIEEIRWHQPCPDIIRNSLITHKSSYFHSPKIGRWWYLPRCMICPERKSGATEKTHKISL